MPLYVCGNPAHGRLPRVEMPRGNPRGRAPTMCGECHRERVHGRQAPGSMTLAAVIDDDSVHFLCANNHRTVQPRVVALPRICGLCSAPPMPVQRGREVRGVGSFYASRVLSSSSGNLINSYNHTP